MKKIQPILTNLESDSLDLLEEITEFEYDFLDLVISLDEEKSRVKKNVELDKKVKHKIGK